MEAEPAQGSRVYLAVVRGLLMGLRPTYNNRNTQTASISSLTCFTCRACLFSAVLSYRQTFALESLLNDYRVHTLVWPAQFPFLAPLIPRQRKALAAVELIRDTTNTLIRCVNMKSQLLFLFVTAVLMHRLWLVLAIRCFSSYPILLHSNFVCEHSHEVQVQGYGF
jgi:hypothetical protein